MLSAAFAANYACVQGAAQTPSSPTPVVTVIIPTPVPVRTPLPTLSLTPEGGNPVTKSPLPLSIDQPIENSVVISEVIVVSGKTFPNAIVVVNEQDVEVESNGSWFIAIKLVPGRNLIIATAVDFSGNESVAARVVRYVQNVPTAQAAILPLSLEQPGENAVFNTPLARVKGKTLPDTIVDINEKPVDVFSDGTFSLLLQLNPGLNAIVVSAIDKKGNEGHIIRYVTYRP